MTLPPTKTQWTLPGDVALGRLALAALFVLLGLLVALSFHDMEGASGAGWPFNSFLYKPSDRFADLWFPIALTGHGDPYHSIYASYLPFTYWGLSFVRGYTPAQAAEWFLEFSVVGYLVVCFLGSYAFFGTSVRSLGIAVLLSVALLASYPLLMALDRGNLEAPIGVLCFLSLILLFMDRPMLAALVLAVASSVKGYPLVLGLVFAVRGRLKYGLLAAAVAVLLTLFSLNALGGGILNNWEALGRNMHAFHEGYYGGNGSLHYSADPYNGVRVLLVVLGTGWPVLSRLGRECVGHYHFFSYPVFWACVVYALFAEAPFHRRFLAVTLGMILWPDLVNDYRLIHLFPVIFFMCVEEGPWTVADKFGFGLVLLLLVPKHYIFLFSDVSVSCLVSPLLLIALLVRLTLDRLAWKAVVFKLRHPQAAWAALSVDEPGAWA